MRRIVLLLLAAPLLADVETATFFLTRAGSEMDAGRLDEAEKFIERSLSEESGFMPALVMKARLAERRGNRKAAIGHLEAVLARKATARGSVEGRAIREAEELMKKLDRARSDYEKLLVDYVDRLLALAYDNQKRKPKLATACYQQILAVQPTHPEALQKLKASAEGAKKKKTPAKRPSGEPLFNGKNLKGWTGTAPSWTVKEKILRARLDGVAQLNLRHDRVRGDFEYICELRFVETMGKDPLVGMLFGGLGRYDHFGLWIFDDSLRLERQTEERKRSELQRKNVANLKSKFSRNDWHVYRVVREGKRITVYVDDEKVFSFAGADREPDGFIGIWAQDSLVEFRSVSLAR